MDQCEARDEEKTSRMRIAGRQRNGRNVRMVELADDDHGSVLSGPEIELRTDHIRPLFLLFIRQKRQYLNQSLLSQFSVFFLLLRGIFFTSRFALFRAHAREL